MTASPASSPTAASYLKGRTPVFAARTDQRFSYCLYVPSAHADSDQPLPLVVLVHGTARTGPQYRDGFADWAEEHNAVVLAPLFPGGIAGPGELHSYKFLMADDLRYDHILLDIVDEVAGSFHVDAERFLLHGFSGGGQFAQRFFYLHPDRLRAVSIGAPGRVTLLDDTKDWWLGTRDLEARSGVHIDIPALRKIPVHMVVGALDTETWEINNVGDANWLDGADATGKTRIERLDCLRRNFEEHGIPVKFEIVPDVGHRGSLVRPAVKDYFSSVLQSRPLR
jgi:dienelactone hydrolase